MVREDFTKVYAVSRDQSKTSAAGFRRFLDRLGQQAEEVDPERWFRPGVASLAVKVQRDPSTPHGCARPCRNGSTPNRMSRS